MEPVLSLIKDNALWRVDYVCSYFFTPVSREAMHDNGIRFCHGKKSLIQLVVLKCLPSSLDFSFLSHAIHTSV